MVLERLWHYTAAMDFPLEILSNRTAVYLHFPYWTQNDFTERDCSAQGGQEWATGEDCVEGLQEGVPPLAQRR